MGDTFKSSQERSPEEQRFGDVAVSLGYINLQQLEEVLREQTEARRNGTLIRLGQIMLKREFLTTDQVLRIMSERETRTGRETALMAVRSPMPGESLGPGKILGRYKIIRRIGRGGMGVVYEALDSVLKRKVALKVLRDDVVDATLARRFEREALTAARLKHPHIVTLYEAGVIDDIRFLAMELVRGASLSDWIVASNLTVDRKVEILEEVARAVEYAHSRGVVHRDLKPGNIMLDEEARPMIMDFGLARLIGDVTHLSRKGAMLGTPSYMAPEQITGSGSIDGRTDIYALGVMMYELLGNRMPFEGGNVQEICRKIIETDPAPIPGLPRELEAIRAKAMARDRMARYSTAGELADELRRYREGEPVQVCPPSLLQSLKRTVRRHRVASTGIAALLLAGILGTLFFVWFEARQEIARADRLLSDAADARQRHEELRLQLAELNEEIREAEEDLEPRSPKEEKEAVWKWKRERKELRSELLRTEARIVGFFIAALSHDERAAEEMLKFYWMRLLQTQAEGDISSAEMYQESMRQMAEDRGYPFWIRILDSGGKVEIDSTPRADSIDIFLLTENSAGPGGQVEVRRNVSLPFRDDALDPGPYLFLLRKAGYPELRLPVLVSLGKEVKINARLLSADQIGEGFIHVPAGPFISGDPGAYLGMPRRPSVFVDDFIIGRHEVTRAGYVQFLNHLVRTGKHDLAHVHLPYEVMENGRLHKKMFLHDHQAESDFRLAAGLHAQAPVTSLPWDSAVAYAEWLSKETGERYRLPTGLEWEKAARGVDGRTFAWGEFFDWEFMNGYYTRERPGVVAVGSYPLDRSPYGLYDVGGNAAEWTMDIFSLRKEKDGIVFGASGGRTSERHFHVSARFPQIRQSRPKWVGFRLVKEVPAP